MTVVEQLKKKRVLTRARKNVIQYKHSNCKSISKADTMLNKYGLIGSFIFANTPEGKEFWWEINEQIEKS